MLVGTFSAGEKAGAFNNHINIHFAPLQIGGISLCSYFYAVSVDYQIIAICFYITLETTLYRVVLKQVSQCFGICKVIDRYNFYLIIIMLENTSGDQTTYASETVNTNFNFSHETILRLIIYLLRLSHKQGPISCKNLTLNYHLSAPLSSKSDICIIYKTCMLISSEKRFLFRIYARQDIISFSAFHL